MKRWVPLVVGFLAITSACFGGSDESLNAKDEDICYRFQQRWSRFSMYDLLMEDADLMKDVTTPATTQPGSGKYAILFAEGAKRPDYGWKSFADELRLSENDTLRGLGYLILEADSQPDIGASEEEWLDWAIEFDIAIQGTVATCGELRGR